MYTYLNEQISLAHKQPIETIALHTGKRENGKNIYMYIRRRQRRRESLRIRICRLKTQQSKAKKIGGIGLGSRIHPRRNISAQKRNKNRQ